MDYVSKRLVSNWKLGFTDLIVPRNFVVSDLDETAKCEQAHTGWFQPAKVKRSWRAVCATLAYRTVTSVQGGEPCGSNVEPKSVHQSDEIS